MNIKFYKHFVLLLLLNLGCNSDKQNTKNNADTAFTKFEDTFLDAYWKHYPTGSVYIGYGKYYDQLVIPDSLSFVQDLSFSKAWLDSLNTIDYKGISENNKISFNIIKNQLESDIWYNSVFKPQEWDASIYNISSASYYIINQPYAPLDERLKILSLYLQHSDDYYKAAFNNLRQPTKEHLELAILQNKGGLEIFGTALTDSIKASHLSKAEKDALNQNIYKTVNSIKDFRFLETYGGKCNFYQIRLVKMLIINIFKATNCVISEFPPKPSKNQTL